MDQQPVGSEHRPSQPHDERALLTRIHKLERSLLEKSQPGGLDELLQMCKDTSVTATVTFNCARALQRVFEHLASKGALDFTIREEAKSTTRAPKRDDNSTAGPHYRAFLQTLVSLLAHRHDQIKILSLKTLMMFLEKEFVTFNTANKENLFPFSLFSSIIEHVIVESDSTETGLFNQFVSKYLSKYDDVRYYTLKALRGLSKQITSARKAGSPSAASGLVESIYFLLQKVKMPSAEHEISSFWIPPNEDAAALPEKPQISKAMQKKAKRDVYVRTEVKKQKKRAKANLAKKKSSGMLAVKFLIGHKKMFEACWLAFLALPLTTPIYKDVLRRMDTHILPHMMQPIRLIDFLRDSYEVGGVVSLLSLQGLFVLVTKHNLDYPDFYKKLYALLQPNIFYVKYRVKFFCLLNIFLNSTHLPAYLVAAFMKRMARMALHAPPSGALFVIALIYNLLKKHKQCQVMLHRADSLSSGSLLPVDSRKPTGMRKTDDVLMLNPQVPTGPPLGDSNGNSDGIEKKRKRDEEEEEKETEDDRSSEGSAPDKKQKLGEDGMDQPTEVDETRKSEKGCVGVGTLEQNEAALKLYLHVGAQGSDPFDLEELDPKNCKALSSSLWELKTLQHHYVPQVSKLAKIFDEPLAKQPFDLDDFVDHSYLSLFQSHVKRKTKSATELAYQPQETLFSRMDSGWAFQTATLREFKQL